VTTTYELSHSRALEAEAVHVLREVVATFERPALSFSGGKDSVVLLHLAGNDAVFGGARRDEDGARAKERVFSFRDEFGQWEPRCQWPELWGRYNGAHRPGEHIRVFPLSNWTESDIWNDIHDERIDVPSLYYAHRRQVVARDGMLLPVTRHLTVRPDEMTVRFRTVGDATCTGCVPSAASTGGRRRGRGGGRQVDRARRDPRRRPDQRVRYGGSQEGGLLLMPELLRIATSGGVDDGKFTLIGRLLFDTKAIFADRLAAIESASRRRGAERTDLALLTDGLRAERERGITIDVAYHYFATPQRKFIIADTPGHIQYTRNMVTGASTADLALILIDARGGMLEQTRRHAFIEQVHIASDRNLIDARLPVQHVIRSSEFRGYAGTVSGGVFRPGDDVLVLPSRRTTTITAIWDPGGTPVADAFGPQAVTMRLADEIDIGRGDLICRPRNQPHAGRDLDAIVCWLTDRATLAVGDRYTVQHTTRTTKGLVGELAYRIDVNTPHPDERPQRLALNEIGRIRLRTQQPLLFDEYRRNRLTGSFILVDETTNDTVATGIVLAPGVPNVAWHAGAVHRAQRGSRGATVWLTGLSGAGKSTVAVEIERLLVAAGRPVYRLDGDNLRHGLNADLGFGAADRTENVRRVGEVAKLLADAGVVAVVALISPYQADRAVARATHQQAGLPFVEVFVDTPLRTCETRDPKGMYAKARAGLITGFTGIDDPYEVPTEPDLVLRPDDGDPATMAARVVAALGEQ
jgi:adenylyl-sulfate kinase